MHKQLDEYIKRNGLKPSFVAEQVGITVQQLWQIRRNKAKPSKAVAILIKQLTNGEIDFTQQVEKV